MHHEQPTYELDEREGDIEFAAAREAVLDRFADVPMAYTVNGVTYRANGARQALMLCPHLQDGTLSADYLEYKFEEAAELAQETPAEEMEEVTALLQEEPDVNTDDVQVGETVRAELAPVKKIVVAKATREIVDELVTTVLSSEPTELPIPMVRGGATKQQAVHQDDLPNQPVTVELNVAAHAELALDLEDTQAREQIIEPVESTTSTIQTGYVAAIDSEPIVIDEQTIDSAADVAFGISAYNDDANDTSLASEITLNDEDPGDQDVVGLTQALEDFDKELIKVEAQSEATNEQANEPKGVMVAPIEDSTVLADDFLTSMDIDEIAPTYENREDTNDFASEEFVIPAQEETVEFATDQDGAVSLLERVAMSEQLNGTEFALPLEIEQIVVELVGEAPHAAPQQSTQELCWRADVVVRQIELLEKARTAEACKEALDQIREELTELLLQLGYTDASSLAERLTRQYDTATLKKYIAVLLRTLLVAQTKDEQIIASSLVQQVPYHRYGAQAVRMVVSFVRQYQTAAA